jgi:hypothetical protein
MINTAICDQLLGDDGRVKGRVSEANSIPSTSCNVYNSSVDFLQVNWQLRVAELGPKRPLALIYCLLWFEAIRFIGVVRLVVMVVAGGARQNLTVPITN